MIIFKILIILAISGILCAGAYDIKNRKSIEFSDIMAIISLLMLAVVTVFV